MVKEARLGKEIAVTVSNKIGVLADMSKIVSDLGVNIEAVEGYAVGKEAKITFVTSDNAKVISGLRKSGYKSILENEVIVLELDNKAGELKEISAKLNSENIDITNIYGTTCSSDCPAKIVISTVANARALEAIKK